MSNRVLVGVDVGGTFTDCVVLDGVRNEVRISKVPTSPSNQAEGLASAVDQAWGKSHWDFDVLVHGTTVATNAVLERRGGVVALVTTRGFGDVLEMRRRDRPHLYGLGGDFKPIVPRSAVFELSERVTSGGVVEATAPLEELDDLVTAIRRLGPAVVVVSLMNAYANPSNERDVVSQLSEALDPVIVLSATELTREFREFERTSTAVVGAYVHPLMERYLTSLAGYASERGHASDVWVVQSNGGRMTLDVAREKAAATILSGPAAGVVAGQRIAVKAGLSHIVTMDMGGTSLDVGMVVDERIVMSAEAQLEFGIPLRLPMVDVHTVAAGGGSVAKIDHEGLLTVGPESAGSSPGPACYGRGGQLPTVTDANVVLGRIGAGQALGTENSVVMDRNLALAAVSTLARALSTEPERAAEGVLAVANRRIADAVRMVTVERGFRSSDFSLVSFGGAGGLHVCGVMRDVGFRRALIPRLPGLTSALGCVLGDIRHDFVQTVDSRLTIIETGALKKIADDHRVAASEMLQREGAIESEIVVTVEADMCYEGQTHTVAVSVGPRIPSLDGLVQDFETTYQRRFGRLFPHATIVLVNLRTSVFATGDGYRPHSIQEGPAQALRSQERATRLVHHLGSWEEWPIAARAELVVGSTAVGPLIIEQPDATCVIEPGFSIYVDGDENMIILNDEPPG